MARTLAQAPSYQCIIEWGSGGGANVVHFALKSNEYYGVDIYEPSLAECCKQLELKDFKGFTPVCINASEPETAKQQIPPNCDLFLYLYVFEIFMTPEYGLRIMQIAYDILKTGGLAFIQIRYITPSWESKPRRWKYSKNLTGMTSYRIDEFWEAAQSIGLSQKVIKLLPKQELNSGDRYAYYLLHK